jgi:hypothetical protein
MGSCEHGNEPSGSIKDKFHDYLGYYYLLCKDSAPWSLLMTCLKITNMARVRNFVVTYDKSPYLEFFCLFTVLVKDTRGS